jgi:hypothetical protein
LNWDVCDFFIELTGSNSLRVHGIEEVIGCQSIGSAVDLCFSSLFFKEKWVFTFSDVVVPEFNGIAVKFLKEHSKNGERGHRGIRMCVSVHEMQLSIVRVSVDGVL